MRCNKCGYKNNEGAKFCKKCGTSLDNKKKSNMTLWIVIASIVIVASIGVAIYKNNMRWSQDDENLAYYEDEFYQDYQEDDNEPTINKEESNSRSEFDIILEKEYYLPIDTRIVREKDNYSGPAIIQIMFNLHGMDLSQEEQAKLLHIQNGGVSDYEDVTKAINDVLRVNAYSKYYNSVYLEPENMNIFNEYSFEKLIENNLIKNDPVIICINGMNIGGSNDPAYAVIYRQSTYSDGTTTYGVYCPINNGEDYSLTLSELIMGMKDCGFVCYIS